MKVSFSYTFLLITTSFLSLTGCDNTIDVDAEFNERTFVFGLLNQGSDTHYIRIQKSFLQPGVNPYNLTEDYTNTYYGENEISVFVEEWFGNTMTRNWKLEYVSGDSLNLLKDEGLFAESPNILYRFSAQLDYTANYRLIIQNHKTTEIVTAETALVQPFEVLFPTSSIPGFNFTDTTRIYYIFRYAVNANIYDLKMHIRYTEENLSNGTIENKTLDWKMFSNVLGDNTYGSGIIAYPLPANAFLYFMQSALESNTQVLRTFQNFDLIFYAGGEAMYLNYLYLLANTGITEQYANTQYTNVTNGFGIFSSVFTVSLNDLIVTAKTIDSLACSTVTGHLQFSSDISNPAYPYCE